MIADNVSRNVQVEIKIQILAAGVILNGVFLISSSTEANDEKQNLEFVLMKGRVNKL